MVSGLDVRRQFFALLATADAVLRLAAPLARLAGKTGASALEQFQDERLVRLDDSGQRLGLVQGGRAQKPVSPAERRGRVDAAALCGLGEAGSLEHRLGVVEPLLLFAQPRHRRLRQGVEGAPAALLADLPVHVVATTGAVVAPSEVATPPNVIVLNYAAHDPIMRRAALVITHGGHGTAMRALLHGLPMVVIPGLAGDQPFVAAAVQEFGAGLALPGDADA